MVFLNALEMCPLLLGIYQLLITAGNLISSKCFEAPSDLGTTCSKLNTRKARQALQHVPPPMGTDGPLTGLRVPLFKENVLFHLKKSVCIDLHTHTQTLSCTADSFSSTLIEDEWGNHDLYWVGTGSRVSALCRIIIYRLHLHGFVLHLMPSLPAQPMPGSSAVPLQCWSTEGHIPMGVFNLPQMHVLTTTS